MSEEQRDARGRFAKGRSGNPKGRPFRLKRDPNLPAARRAVIRDIADREIEITIDGKSQKMSLYEANVLTLGSAGARGDRIAARMFVEMTRAMSEQDLMMRLEGKMMIRRMVEAEAQNESLKQKLRPTSGVLPIPMSSAEELLDWENTKNAYLEKIKRIDDDEGVRNMVREMYNIPLVPDKRGPKP